MAGDGIYVAPKGANGLHGWPVLLGISDLEEALEKEPNDDPAHATAFSAPAISSIGAFPKDIAIFYLILFLRQTFRSVFVPR